jgi:transcriptional regulator
VYQPPHFRIDGHRKAAQFIRQQGFGMLVSNCNGRLFATHMPVLLNEDNTLLSGHIARLNPQHEELAGQEVLFIIQGPHGYVSPTLYENPGVPTWNYQAVHVYGIASLVNDPESVRQIVDRLTHEHESTRIKPWHGEYNTGKLRAIVGIEIAIREIQCKFKLSQNRSTTERDNAAKDAAATGNPALAAAISDLVTTEQQVSEITDTEGS